MTFKPLPNAVTTYLLKYNPRILAKTITKSKNCYISYGNEKISAYRKGEALHYSNKIYSFEKSISNFFDPAIM